MTDAVGPSKATIRAIATVEATENELVLARSVLAKSLAVDAELDLKRDLVAADLAERDGLEAAARAQEAYRDAGSTHRDQPSHAPAEAPCQPTPTVKWVFHWRADAQAPFQWPERGPQGLPCGPFLLISGPDVWRHDASGWTCMQPGGL